MKKRRVADKPDTKRKEAKTTMPAGTISPKKTKIEKISFGGTITFAPGKIVKTMWRPPMKKQDALLHDGRSEIERKLILEWREDGMSDSEIQKWLQEI